MAGSRAAGLSLKLRRRRTGQARQAVSIRPPRSRKTPTQAMLIPRFKRYMITGVLTVLPVGLTLLLFSWIWGQLAALGAPLVAALAGMVSPVLPRLASLLRESMFTAALGVLLVLSAVYAIGWMANRVLGKRILDFVDRTMDRLPIIAQVHGAIRKTLGSLQSQPKGAQRVVLIPFPTPEMRTVGLVTRIFRDSRSGREVAAVYVPTTPNPTSGYLEIVPLEHVQDTGWTVDQAMTFIISGGTVGPEQLPYDPPAPTPTSALPQESQATDASAELFPKKSRGGP